MSSSFKHYAELFDQRAQRERVLLASTLLTLLLFAWWWLIGQPIQTQTVLIDEQNGALQRELDSLGLTAARLEQRLAGGVHKLKEEQLARLKTGLRLLEEDLEQKAFELIGPNDMFALMSEMLFGESRLELSSLKRKQVRPVFSDTQDSDQPTLFRHVMSVEFSGEYPDIVNYLDRLEQADWILIWDRISLTTVEYPRIQVEIEISTLSDSAQWVGL